MSREPNDPIVDEVRAIRHQISARFDHDPARLAAHYIELQERYRDRLIERLPAHGRGDESAA